MANEALVKPRKRGRPPKARPEVPASQDAYEDPRDEAPIQAPANVPDAEFAVVRDPWGEQDFMRFRKHPDGFVLRWCNPNKRNSSGWRGWAPVLWSSALGQTLGEYLIDPPHRFQGGLQSDDMVRIGNDLILCQLPAAAYAARMREKQAKRDRIMKTLDGGSVVDPNAPDRQAEYAEPKPVRGMVVPRK